MSKLKVALRVRPLSEREILGGFPVVIAVQNDIAFVTDIRVPESSNADSRQRTRAFHFDHCFSLQKSRRSSSPFSEGVAATQAEVYAEIGPQLENAVLQGYNACLLAYGQSGTGKTHTMMGSKDDPGVIPQLCQNLWEKALDLWPLPKGFRMEVSFMEIYREKVRDLLASVDDHGHGQFLKLREHPQFGPHVQGLTRVEIREKEGLTDLLWEGERKRATGTTGSNSRSSRSHAIWTVYLTRESGGNGEPGIRNQVHLVDLAGSERAGFTAAKNLLAEGADINKSLVALGNVISALAEKAQYIPYRDSALTWLLKDSLGGNATTAIIITASPSSSCHPQTLNSFRFAQRARLVENSPRINNFPGEGVGTGSGSALYAIMSAFEIKKDISKLSRIIRTAQNNGGILRGFTPRANWTRLVTALEGFNQIESEHLRIQRERAASVDTSTPSISSDQEKGQGESHGMKSKSWKSKLFKHNSNGSVGGAPQSHQNSPSRGIFSKRIQASNSLSEISERRGRKKETTTSKEKPSKANEVKATEVFIPTSSSFKCLTWKQEEIKEVPAKKRELEKMEFSKSPSKIEMKAPSVKNLLFPVQFAVPQHSDIASRISERIHQSIPPLKYERGRVRTEPDFVTGNDQLLEVRERVPTMLKERESEERLVLVEQVGQLPEENVVKVPVVFKDERDFHYALSEDSSEESGSRSGSVEIFSEEEDGSEACSSSSSTIGEFISYSGKGMEVKVLEKVEDDFQDPEKVEAFSRNKLVKKEDFRLALAKRRGSSLTLNLPPIPSLFSKILPRRLSPFEDLSDSEFQEPVVEPERLGSSFRTVEKAEVSQDLIFPENYEEETLENIPCLTFLSSPIWSETETESESERESSEISWNFYQEMEARKVPVLEKRTAEEEEMREKFESVEEWVKDVNFTRVVVNVEEEQEQQAPENSKKNSKFRNHFGQELSQMDRIGKQLKALKEMSKQCQKFGVVGPYLQKITEMDPDSFLEPDPELDPHIEECSGWCLETEMKLVNQELTSLSKLLKIGGGRAEQQRRMSGEGSNCSYSTAPKSLSRSSTETEAEMEDSPIDSPSPSNKFLGGKARRVSSESGIGLGGFPGKERRFSSLSETALEKRRKQGASGGRGKGLQFQGEVQYPHQELEMARRTSNSLHFDEKKEDFNFSRSSTPSNLGIAMTPGRNVGQGQPQNHDHHSPQLRFHFTHNYDQGSEAFQYDFDKGLKSRSREVMEQGQGQGCDCMTCGGNSRTGFNPYQFHEEEEEPHFLHLPLKTARFPPPPFPSGHGQGHGQGQGSSNFSSGQSQHPFSSLSHHHHPFPYQLPYQGGTSLPHHIQNPAFSPPLNYHQLQQDRNQRHSRFQHGQGQGHGQPDSNHHWTGNEISGHGFQTPKYSNPTNSNGNTHHNSFNLHHDTQARTREWNYDKNYKYN